MSFIKILNSNHQLGRANLIEIFLFWFEEDVISLYDDFKLEQKTDSEKKKIKSSEKKCSKHKEYCERNTLVLQ